MNSLIFIDTNILLDFYRRSDLRTRSLLDHLSLHSNKFIVTEQIKMEFLKRRQQIILELSKNYRPENININLKTPFQELDKKLENLQKTYTKLKSLSSEIKEETLNFIKEPTSDSTLTRINKLFSLDHDLYLTEKNEYFNDIFDRAKKRFLMNKPPRKSSDTSLGDSLNWEWIIECSKNMNKNVIIVAKDSDFGIIDKSKGIINDWLKEEFYNRTGKDKNITLTPILSEAYELAEIPVSEQERKEEILNFISYMDEILQTLSPTEEKILRMRFGITQNDNENIEGLKKLSNSVADSILNP